MAQPTDIADHPDDRDFGLDEDERERERDEREEAALETRGGNGHGKSKDRAPTIRDKVALNKWFNELGSGQKYKCRLYRDSPDFHDFGNGPEKVGGFLRSYTTQVDEDAILEEHGGGDFSLKVYSKGRQGLVANVHFSITGVPKPLPADRRGFDIRRGVPGPYTANPANVSAQEQPLLRQLIDHGNKDRDQERAARERIEGDYRESERMNSTLRAELAEMRAEVRALRESLPRAGASDREHERELMKMSQAATEKAAEAQTRALETMAKQSTDTLRELREATFQKEEKASEPLRQFMTEQAERTKREREDERERHKQELEAEKERRRAELEATRESNRQLMEMFKQQNEASKDLLKSQADAQSKLSEQRMNDLKTEIDRVRLEKKAGMLGDLGELAKVFESLQKFGKKFGKDDEEDDRDIVQRIIDAAPDILNSLPAVAAAGRHAFTGEPMAIVPPPALPQHGAGPEHVHDHDMPPEAPPGRSEEDQEAALIIQQILQGFDRHTPPSDLARSITTQLGTATVRKLIAQPADELVEKIAERVPELNSTAARMYLRAVHSAFVASIAH